LKILLTIELQNAHHDLVMSIFYFGQKEAKVLPLSKKD